MAYRATRDEPRVAVGDWTRDLHKGEVLPTDRVPDEVADHLMGHGLLIEVEDDAEDNPWFDSDDPELANPPKAEAEPAAKASTTKTDKNNKA
jgi:hypothetical protein